MEDISLLLPEKPRAGLIDWVKKTHPEQLGDEYCVFRRESITIYPEMKQTMRADDWDEYDKNTHRRWAAACTCTACGDDFLAGYWKDRITGHRGISLLQFEDGTFVDGFVEKDDDPDVIRLGVGDGFPCPLCGAEIQLLPATELRSGRTYQIAIASVERINRHAAVVVWMVTRHVDLDGSYTSVRPYTAMQIGEKGKLTSYTHVNRYENGVTSHRDKWRKLTRRSDGMRTKYYDYDSVCHLKAGGFTWPSVPNLDGTTGEKTGLADYVKRGGQWPNFYLETWRNHRNIEQLIKSPLGAAIAKLIDGDIDRHFFAGYSNCYPVDFTETKPHRMLHMTKEDIRIASKLGWSGEHVEEWMRFWIATGSTVQEFNEVYRALSLSGLKELLTELEKAPGVTPMRVKNYLTKQSLCGRHGVRLYIDYRKAMISLRRDEPETWYPRDLVRAHDEATAQVRAKDDLPYTEIVERYAPIAYSDGEICIRVAGSAEELREEGRVLHHCVGGYGKSHQSGKDTIFFVRHARRPERSWYTLDIRMTDGEPYEVQLHGYKNELSGAHNGKKLVIPDEVREFVDRWKEDVLLPWWRAQAQPGVTVVKNKEGSAA